MGRFLIKLDEWYLEWSTVVDGPVTYGMSRDEMRDYLIEEYGRFHETESDERLARCDKNGTSAHGYASVMDVIQVNRAGPNEEQLGREEIIRRYCVERLDQDAPSTDETDDPAGVTCLDILLEGVEVDDDTVIPDDISF